MSNGSYQFQWDGTTVLPGVQKDRSGNNDLKWEETKQLNFGIDAAFFDNRLGLTLDYFQKKTTGMLIQKPYIGVIGEGGYNGTMLPVWIIAVWKQPLLGEMK